MLLPSDSHDCSPRLSCTENILEKHKQRKHEHFFSGNKVDSLREKQHTTESKS
jgi:hypothetical protein